MNSDVTDIYYIDRLNARSLPLFSIFDHHTFLQDNTHSHKQHTSFLHKNTMSEQTPTLTNGNPTTAYTNYPRITALENSRLGTYKTNPHRVKGVDSHFFNPTAEVVDQSWHEGGILGIAKRSEHKKVMTDTSELHTKFKSTCPESGTFPTPTGVTAVVSEHAVIAYLTTQTSIQTAKSVWIVPVSHLSIDIKEAIFKVEGGIYRAQDLGTGVNYTAEFATEEAKRMLGSDAEGFTWTRAGKINFHELKDYYSKKSCVEDESDGESVPYEPEEHGELRKAMEGR